MKLGIEGRNLEFVAVEVPCARVIVARVRRQLEDGKALMDVGVEGRRSPEFAFGLDALGVCGDEKVGRIRVLMGSGVERGLEMLGSGVERGLERVLECHLAEGDVDWQSKQLNMPLDEEQQQFEHQAYHRS